MSIKNALYTGICAVALIGFVPVSNAADTTAKNDTSTGVSTDVGTLQSNGVTVGDKAHIKGDVYTGSNTASTDVNTDVSTKTSTDAAAADGDMNDESTTVGTVKGKGTVRASNSDTTVESKSKREAHWDSGKKYGHEKQDNWEKRDR